MPLIVNDKDVADQMRERGIDVVVNDPRKPEIPISSSVLIASRLRAKKALQSLRETVMSEKGGKSELE